MWIKDNFVALGANKKIITEQVKIKEKEDTGMKLKF
jgi:ribosomal protein S18